MTSTTILDCYCLREKADTIFTWPSANNHSEACRTFRQNHPEYAEKILPTCSREESREFDRLNLLNGWNDGVAAWRWRWKPTNTWRVILSPRF